MIYHNHFSNSYIGSYGHHAGNSTMEQGGLADIVMDWGLSMRTDFVRELGVKFGNGQWLI